MVLYHAPHGLLGAGNGVAGIRLSRAGNRRRAGRARGKPVCQRPHSGGAPRSKSSYGKNRYTSCKTIPVLTCNAEEHEVNPRISR